MEGCGGFLREREKRKVNEGASSRRESGQEESCGRYFEMSGRGELHADENEWIRRVTCG